MQERELLTKLAEKQLHCTGCGGCANVCPTKAITMLPDELGFYRPQIKQDICVDCKICVGTCPVLNDFPNHNYEQPACYAVQADDVVRKKSSSGGVFTLLAEKVLADGGAVVGVVMDVDLSVHHMCIRDAEELDRLRKSKYVQSDVKDIYREVRTILEQGKVVLFTGTPCQAAALRAVLGKEYENLYVVDILCHGVPSQKMLRESVASELGKAQVCGIDFRDKNYGWDSLNMTVVLTDGTTRRLSYNESRYEQGFHPGITLQESCYQCKFCEFPRWGDLSIGDFWRVDEVNPAYDDRKGTSVLLINSEKGRKLWAQAATKAVLAEETPLQALEHNRIHKETPRAKEREYFLSLYPKKKNFDTAVWDAQRQHHDVAIVGNWSYPNYGSELTYYALYRVILETGRTAIMLSWPKSAEWKPYETAQLFKSNPYPVWDVAELPETHEDLRKYNQLSDVFLLGSDQLLNNNLYNWFDRFVQMDWVLNNKRKIAYAASFGTDYIWGSDEDRAQMAHFLQEFDAFSVREESGIELLKNHYGVQAESVLDPVFLTSEKMLDEMVAVGKERVPDKKYLFAYMLDPDSAKAEILKRCGQKLQLEPQAVRDAAPEEHRLESDWDIPTLYDVKLEEWVAFIRHCGFMITDSFHGMCMAIRFHKPFVAICNESRGTTRFVSILKKLGLEERLLASEKLLDEKLYLLEKEIDYAEVERRLQKLQKQSRQWLETALSEKLPPKGLSTYDLIAPQLLRFDETDAKQWQQLEDHRLRLDGIDAVNAECRERLNQAEVTDAKQWQQLEDHRLRMDGIDAVNAECRQMLDEYRRRIDDLDAKLQQAEKRAQKFEKIAEQMANRCEELEKHGSLYRAVKRTMNHNR